jgi:hypothetical protein
LFEKSREPWELNQKYPESCGQHGKNLFAVSNHEVYGGGEEHKPGIIVCINHRRSEEKITNAPCILAFYFFFGSPKDIGRKYRLESEESVRAGFESIGNKDGRKENQDARC